MTTSTADLDAALAATRFGLGARPGEIAEARRDPRGWLKAQITPAGADQPGPPGQPLPSSADRLAGFYAYRERQKAEQEAAAAAGQPPPKKMKGGQEEIGLTDEFLARAQLGTGTPAAFRENWTLFWANHFTAAATKGITAALVGPFEREAIRPHVFGRFEDLLQASSHHPAMLTYLDQERSVGPDSMAGEKRHQGLNENLAREIMELHSVGVDAGYTQADVTEFAKALTGWSMGAQNAPPEEFGRFVFRANLHEPGARTIMGRSYRQEGEAQAEAVLHDLAASPHTAHHLAVQIARHFVADDPPPQLVARLEQAYRSHDGHLGKVAEALVDAPEAWDPRPSKIKDPYVFLVSGYRAVGAQPQDVHEIWSVLIGLGQRAWMAPSPKGWPEDSASWSAPDAVVKRIAWAQGFAQKHAALADPNDLARQALGARLTPAAATAISRAESRPEAVALLLMSPEFQRT